MARYAVAYVDIAGGFELDVVAACVIGGVAIAGGAGTILGAILGALFRSTQFQKGETELLIIVTPRLVRPIRPDQVKLPTDRVADPTSLGTVLMGEPYDPVPAEQLAKPQGDAAAGGDYDY